MRLRPTKKKKSLGLLAEVVCARGQLKTMTRKVRTEENFLLFPNQDSGSGLNLFRLLMG